LKNGGYNIVGGTPQAQGLKGEGNKNTRGNKGWEKKGGGDFFETNSRQEKY